MMFGSSLITDLDLCAGCTCEARRVGPHSLPLCGGCQVVEQVTQDRVLVYVRVFRKTMNTHRPLRLILELEKA
jgi:hypothetical protein